MPVRFEGRSNFVFEVRGTGANEREALLKAQARSNALNYDLTFQFKIFKNFAGKVFSTQNYPLYRVQQTSQGKEYIVNKAGSEIWAARFMVIAAATTTFFKSPLIAAATITAGLGFTIYKNL